MDVADALKDNVHNNKSNKKLSSVERKIVDNLTKAVVNFFKREDLSEKLKTWIQLSVSKQKNESVFNKSLNCIEFSKEYLNYLIRDKTIMSSKKNEVEIGKLSVACEEVIKGEAYKKFIDEFDNFDEGSSICSASLRLPLLRGLTIELSQYLLADLIALMNRKKNKSFTRM